MSLCSRLGVESCHYVGERSFPQCSPASPRSVLPASLNPFALVALSRLPWQVSSLFDGGLSCGLVAVHAPLQWGLGCLLGRSPLQQQGPHQQSTVQDTPANKDRKKRSRKAREGNPPPTGDCSAQPRMQRGDRAAVRRPVRRHLLMAPWPDRRALERLCGTRDPMTARSARNMGHRGTTGEEAASGFSHFFCCFNVCVVETPHVDHRRRVFLCSLTTHPLRSMPPCSGAWVACLGAHPCSSRGHTSNQQCRTPQPTKTGRNGAGRRERAIPHLLGIA
jgi:hypothetical protein